VIQAISYDTKPTNSHKCMKVYLSHTLYTCCMFRALVWPSPGGSIAKDRNIKILQKFWNNFQV